MDDVLGQHVRRTGKPDADLEPAGKRPKSSGSLIKQALMQEAAVVDCPLTSSAEALTSSIPVRLVMVSHADPEAQVQRVWATLCCIAVLQRLNVSWVHGDGDTYDKEEMTIVDGAFQWLSKHAEKHPKLQAALADGKLLGRAKDVTDLWHHASEARVEELRRSEGIRHFMSLSHLHRSVNSVVRAMCMEHSTFSTFLSTPLDGLQRWQMWCIVVSLVLEQLLVNIWMCVIQRALF